MSGSITINRSSIGMNTTHMNGDAPCHEEDDMENGYDVGKKEWSSHRSRSRSRSRSQSASPSGSASRNGSESDSLEECMSAYSSMSEKGSTSALLNSLKRLHYIKADRVEVVEAIQHLKNIVGITIATLIKVNFH